MIVAATAVNMLGGRHIVVATVPLTNPLNSHYSTSDQPRIALTASTSPARRARDNRSQRRTRKKNLDIVIRSRNAELDEQHLELYRAYLASRHADGEMSAGTITDMQRFLISDWCETILIEGWLGERLVLSAVTDVVDNALSALYTYYDPELPDRSLGTLGILEQIEACKSLGFRYLYLGYWIESCRKMRYKSSFQALETRDPEGNWSLLRKH